MKLSILLSLIAVGSVSTMQAVQAQETHGARFNFAANTWREEQNTKPKGYGDPEHVVQAGSMPSIHLLGLDPSMLPAKPGPMPMPMPLARPTVASRVVAPPPISNFNPAFGKPFVAKSPVIPQHALALALPKALAQAGQPSSTNHAPVARSAHSNSVVGSLRHPSHKSTQPVQPQVASYGKNFGYTPSDNLPSAAPARVGTTVSGRITSKTHR